MKFSKDGKFLLQIGKNGASKGNKDTANVDRPAEVEVDMAANEVYVADGYGNRRVIVYDADKGTFKRMWGAYGKPPTDPAKDELHRTIRRSRCPTIGARCTARRSRTTVSSTCATA